MDCSLRGSSVHGILQARILEWVAVPFSGGSSPPRDWTQVSHTAGRFLPPELWPGKPWSRPMVVSFAFVCFFLNTIYVVSLLSITLKIFSDETISHSGLHWISDSVLFSSLEPLTKLSVITCTVNKWKMIFLDNQAFQRYLYSWSQKLLLWDFGLCSMMWPYRCARNKVCLVGILSEWVIHSAIPPPIFFLLKNKNGREEEVAMMTRNSVYQFKWKIYNLLKILMVNSTISTTYTEF